MTFDTDPQVRPVDDLFRHVNGRWLESTPIPDDKARYGAFAVLRDEAEAAVRDIITGIGDTSPAAGSEAAKIADLYASFMDTEAIEARGLTGFEFDRVDAITDRASLLDYLGWAMRNRITSLFGFYVDSDPGDPTRYQLFIGQDGIGLPDEAYYRLDEHAETRAAYQAHIERLLTLAGRNGDAAAILDLETRIAAHHWDIVKVRDLRASYNPMTVADLGEPWATMLGIAGAGSITEVITTQPSFFAEVTSVLDDVDLATWRAWASYHLLADSAHALPDALYQEYFAFYGTYLNGVPTPRDRWKRGVSLVEQHLGEAVGKIYVEQHFSPRAKARMDELVAHLLDAYRASITDLEWMTDATRAEALHKLDSFTPKIGYPDQWQDYTGLEISADDLLGNIRRAAAFAIDDAIDKASGPMRDWEWFMTPQTVNAYYHPLRNEIVFPAAILQPPFFDVDGDDAVNYGAIGAVIGHEIGHGFDDQGSTCDGDGRLRDWWTADDRAAFETRTQALIEQFDGLIPAQFNGDGPSVNGALTIGENIGDLGGLSIAYQAWKLAGGHGDDADGYTAEQRFFLSWARAWQTKSRDEALAEQINTDPHSPDEFRCNETVRNIPAFHEAFGTQPGDGLWRAPQDRIKIW